MAKEIERKFLVVGDGWRIGAQGRPYRQGYLVANDEITVRVRIVTDEGFLTVKGKSAGITRPEYEYKIPPNDANEMLSALCAGPLIEKNRYQINFAGHTWEVDEFFGENSGLVVAEIELASEEEQFVKPEWLGKEVSHDSRYQNANLAKNPFQKWK